MGKTQEKETTLKEYEKTLSGLGEPDKEEPREVAEKRTKLSKEKAGLEKIQSRCQLLDLRSRELSESVDKIKNQLPDIRFTQQSRGSPHRDCAGSERFQFKAKPLKFCSMASKPVVSFPCSNNDTNKGCCRRPGK